MRKYADYLKDEFLWKILLEVVLLIATLVIVKGVFIFLSIILIGFLFTLKLYLQEKEMHEANLNLEGMEFLRILVDALRMGMNPERSYFIASLSFKRFYKPPTLLLLKADNKELLDLLPSIFRPTIKNILGLESLSRIRLNQFVYTASLLRRKTEEIANRINTRKENRRKNLILSVSVSLVMMLAVFLIPNSLKATIATPSFNALIAVLLIGLEGISII